jgi:hypothetical protein
VDDTLIFAGRVREAKRARLAELDQRLAGSNARHGEGLRMSSIETDPQALRVLQKERDRLAAEPEDDWVRMTIFEVICLVEMPNRELSDYTGLVAWLYADGHTPA